MSLMQVELEDKYRLDAGRIYLSGIQALVRLPHDAAPARPRGRISTPQASSPAIAARRSAMYDHALWRREVAPASATTSPSSPASMRILPRPPSGAASRSACFPAPKSMACSASGTARGPGVDRSIDALKHANSAGTSRHGGVLALAGDDHGCQSSTLAHQSEQVFAAAMMPVLNPATLQDYLDLGLLRLCAVALLPAAGSASRRSPKRSRARPRSTAIPPASQIVSAG